jgi:18S rRNA (guanine1575-N7)-methyltransferase
MGKDRPEHTAPPEIFYGEDEARKYTDNSRMIEIQARLTERALELLALPADGARRLLLDLGCGSGLSGEALAEAGQEWVGLDISRAMLGIAAERGADGDLALSDLGHGVPLRAGTFDGAISISAVQWLCNADTARNDPRRRLRRFFESLYACLTKGARAVLQVYPESTEQASMMTSAAMRAGFSGGLVVDFPHSTRAKKYFLVLMVGGSAGALPAARGLEGEEGEGGGEVRNAERRSRKRGGGAPGGDTRRDYIARKKTQQRGRGAADVRPDTKYSGRKRKDRF